MSLYDMYFSKKNKNYMYETISKLIKEETGFDISHSSHHIEIYRRNYPTIFHSVDTDELSVLNKELINHMGDIYLNSLKNTIQPNVTKSPKEIVHKSDPKIQEKKYKNHIIHSSHRNSNSLNRYDFNINVDFNEFNPKKITLLKEDNNLFSNPSIIVRFNETDNLQFSLKETKSYNDKEYYTYECITEDTIQCENMLNIKILNYLMLSPSDKCDIYKINMIKPIKHDSKDYLCFQIDNHDIHINDELGILNDNKIVKSLVVKKCVQNYILTNIETIDLTKEYSCIQLNKNIEISGYKV
jgi:hypothetical protein